MTEESRDDLSIRPRRNPKQEASDLAIQCEFRTALSRKWLWPRSDLWGWKHPLQHAIPDLSRILGSSSDPAHRAVALQAGGLCGMIPWFLTHFFDNVLTFEPDKLNFFCLVNNTQGSGVFSSNFALGRKSGVSVELHRPFSFNLGAHRILEQRPDPERGNGTYDPVPGPIPMISIDSLNLPRLDALFLDVEEYEDEVLFGAAATLERCQPRLIAVETCTGIVNSYLEQLDYKPMGRFDEQSDWIFYK